MGVIHNWAQLQDEYRCHFEVADYHALTTGYEDTSQLAELTREMAIDWFASGIDPERSVVFVQSHVPEHAELHLLFSMIVQVPRLQRNPTLKEQIRDLHLQKRVTYGHLGYPVLQASDILMYKADAVPVGEDQVPHVEITREIAKKFNELYGQVFPEPEPLLTPFARVPGTDGQRMSKSLGNTILISDAPEVIRTSVKGMFTDPTKIRRGDPGHPDTCPVFAYHKMVNESEVKEIHADCKKGTLGCVDCKARMAERLIDALAPIRNRRAEWERTPQAIDDILAEGSKKAREVAVETMVRVRQAVGFWRSDLMET